MEVYLYYLKPLMVKSGFRLHYILYTAITFIFAILLLFIENNINFNSSSSNISFWFLILSGFIMSIGVVFPGVSSSVLLMILGIYDVYLIAVASLNFSILIPMAIGLVLGGIIFLFIIRYFLNNYFSRNILLYYRFCTWLYFNFIPWFFIQL